MTSSQLPDDSRPRSLSVTSRGPRPDHSLKILFAGDTSFGENYQQTRERNGRENILKSKGYDHAFQAFQQILSDADLVVANLETPVTNLETSPFAGQKSYVHWADVDKTPHHLAKQGIRAVSLANNHAFDFGSSGLGQTIDCLAHHNIVCFGGGANDAAALEPLRISANVGKRRLDIAVFAVYDATPGVQQKYGLAAQADQCGIQILDVERLGNRLAQLKSENPELLAILFPHWGKNYAWRSERQKRRANELVRAGFDLIIGHGAHMLQEITLRRNRWIVFSLGNFVFNSPGRYGALNAPPYSLLAQLTIRAFSDQLAVFLRLYPIVTDNRRTDYQSRFVTEREMRAVRRLLGEKPSTSKQYAGFGFDENGYYIELFVGRR